MADTEDFKRIISEYQLTYGDELQAKLRRLDGIIGDRHWLSVGTYKENLVKSVLGNRIPKKYEVGTGFVLTYRDGKRVLSRQIDVLIWDSEDHSPLFRDGDFVVVPPESCMAAIEIKSTLTSTDLSESLKNLDSLMQFFPDHITLNKKVLHRSIFAFSLGSDLKFPNSLFNSLCSSYQRSSILKLKNRVAFSSKELDRWQLPWVSSISVLGVGNVHCDLWSLNGNNHVVHTAYRANPDEDKIDAYGFLERSVLMDLLLGYQKNFARSTRPGLTGFLFANQANSLDGKSYMPMPPVKITQVGNLKDEENNKWIEKCYSPRKPRRSGSRKLPNSNK